MGRVVGGSLAPRQARRRARIESVAEDRSRSWLFVMKSDDQRSWSANRGYDDSAGLYYSYDSTSIHRSVLGGEG